MDTLWVDIAFGAVMASTGGFAGWWLRRHGQAFDKDGEERRAREVLGRLQDLAVRIAANVGEHSTRVEEINQELNASGGPDVVYSAVSKLLAANEQMQQQLSTAEVRLEEQARLVQTHAEAARTDPLTGLANRRALDDELARRLAEYKRSGKTFSLVLGDVDHFKRFNDTHGHQAGDEVLRGVARTIRKKCREIDLAARYGGEEFAVVVPEMPASEAAALVEMVREAIAKAVFQYGDARLHVAASFGLTESLENDDAAALIRRADEALYASKSGGRNCGHWHDGREIRRIGLSPVAQRNAESQPEAPATAATPPEVRHDRSKGLCRRDEYCTALTRRLAEWRRGGIAPAILLVRVDNFADLLAREGRPTATVVLKDTSQFLTAAIREMDTAAEYEDGTFAMLMPGATLNALIGIAERLRQAICGCALPVPNGPLHFTVSLGGTVSIKGDETHTILWRAEEALDAATKAGGNSSFYHNGQWSETAKAALDRARA